MHPIELPALSLSKEDAILKLAKAKLRAASTGSGQALQQAHGRRA